VTAPEDPTNEQRAEQKPLLKVIDQHATPEDVAAIVTVFSAMAAPEPPKKKQRSLWATPKMRTLPAPGPGAWRASALPR
jgi:hypothetical protein